jgi:hypothetical protein
MYLGMDPNQLKGEAIQPDTSVVPALLVKTTNWKTIISAWRNREEGES